VVNPVHEAEERRRKKGIKKEIKKQTKNKQQNTPCKRRRVRGKVLSRHAMTIYIYIYIYIYIW